MVFRDRQEAAIKLYKLLQKDPSVKKDGVYIASLLRGGVVLGAVLAKKLHAIHLPLVVTKIPAPYNPELAIGALCFDITYLENKIVSVLSLRSGDLREQIKIAEHKFVNYCSRFNIDARDYKKIKNKIVILVDDGIATGASVKAALLFLKSRKPAKIFLAVPVAAADTQIQGFDKLFIINRPKFFGAVSQFYKNFPQIEDEEVKKLIR